MKKSMILWLAMVVLSVMLGNGCTTYHRDAGADYLERPEGVGQIRYRTEYEVAPKRISGEGNASVLFWAFQFSEGKYCQLNQNPHLSFWDSIFEFFSPSQKTVGNAKNSALYNACAQHNADQILGATFEYEITDYFFYSTVECVAKGFPAHVTGVEMLESKRPVILNEWQKIEYINLEDKPLSYSGSQDIIREERRSGTQK